jgi:hypothetical protein
VRESTNEYNILSMQVPFPLLLFFLHRNSYNYGDGASSTKRKGKKTEKRQMTSGRTQGEKKELCIEE